MAFARTEAEMNKANRTKKRASGQRPAGSHPGDLITQTEAARLRGVTRAAIGDLISRGRLRSAGMFGRTLVYRSEVMGFEKQPPGRKRKR
jgi:hypothetical protein